MEKVYFFFNGFRKIDDLFILSYLYIFNLIILFKEIKYIVWLFLLRV